MNYIGIDISKKTFDVAIPRHNGYAHHKFSNDHKGFKELLALLNQNGDWCVMEASGPYYLKLASFLHEQGFNISVVNPLVIRRFCQMLMTRTKTDKKDALMIAEYGKSQHPQLWTNEEAHMLELKQMQAYLDQLNKSKGALIRQEDAFNQNPCLSMFVKESMALMMAQIESQIKSIEKKMKSLINEHYKEQFKLVTSVPGIGEKAGLFLIVLSRGFTKFDNAKQLSSYVGLSPRIFNSGTSIKGKPRICKMGMSRIRAILYVCTWSAIKCNKACKDLYQRLVEKGKSKRLALIAVANKLLKQVFAVATKGELYKEVAI